jgi:hypothetical protein
MMPLVTLDVLTKAIQRSLNVNEDEARRYAEIVMDIFGYHDSIIDNNLEYQDRRLFYRLESEGLLNTWCDETVLHNGKNWRIHYWTLEKQVIFQSETHTNGKNAQKKKTVASMSTACAVYSSLPETAWAGRKKTCYMNTL